MDRLVRLQAASNYTGLESRSAGERYVVVYLAPGAAGTGAEGAALQLNDERITVPEEFADGIPELIERSGLMLADGLTEWNPELPPNIGFHALACEFESGRIFKTSASGFSDVWAAFAAPFMKLVKARFERSVPAEEPEETEEPEDLEESVEPIVSSEPVGPIDLGHVTDVDAPPIETAEDSPLVEPETHVDDEPLVEPGLEYFEGDENEEWLPEAGIDLIDAELDATTAKLDLAESQLEEMESALDAAQAALKEAEKELDM